jgi:hypothetical protein
VSEWKPIGTAPEGVHILLWFPVGERGDGGIEAATIYFYNLGIGLWTHGGPNSGSDWSVRGDSPTHWMPLPAPPPAPPQEVAS